MYPLLSNHPCSLSFLPYHLIFPHFCFLTSFFISFIINPSFLTETLRGLYNPSRRMSGLYLHKTKVIYFQIQI
jgi:hypothetical protein